MKEITYTFIIPHHNCPDLLKRCLNSIPQRDDIQIIVVDDNSDEDKKPIKSNRTDVDYIYIDKNETKGAGRARNRGLTKAKGKWIVFSDSDDFFEKDALNDKMDKYKDTDADIIFFNTDKLDAITLNPMNGVYKYRDIVNENNDNSIEWLRYRSNVPWGKFIKKDLVTQNYLSFSECIAGNDLYFSVTTGHYSTNTLIDIDTIYHWCLRSKGNISSNLSEAAILSKYEQTKLRNVFLISVNKSKWVSNIFVQYWGNMRKIGYSYGKIWGILWNDTPKSFRIKHIFETLRIFIENRFRNRRSLNNK